MKNSHWLVWRGFSAARFLILMLVLIVLRYVVVVSVVAARRGGDADADTRSRVACFCTKQRIFDSNVSYKYSFIMNFIENSVWCVCGDVFDVFACVSVVWLCRRIWAR